MAVTTKHPLYDRFHERWVRLRDTEEGEDAVKAKRFTYLPPTQGMRLDGCEKSIDSDGGKAYSAYLTRAHFPELVRHAIEKVVGVMHAKPAKIELPKRMERMLTRATRDRESLQMLLRKINTEQIHMGRVGILLEAPTIAVSREFPLPFFVVYKAEAMTNWDDGRSDDVENGPVSSLNLVVLDESEPERTGDLEWQSVEKYRVCFLGDLDKNEAKAGYRVVVVRATAGGGSTAEVKTANGEESASLSLNAAAAIEPVIDGRKADEIPFVFINTTDIVAAPARSPMQALSNLSLTIYRGEADYRQSLFQQGQDTLVTMGFTGEGKHRIGAGASIDVPMGGDAKFIGVDSAGLPEQREALQNDYQRAETSAGELLDSSSRDKESGEALKVRVASRSASLHQIALTGAYGLEEGLKKAARWLGISQTEIDAIKVEPNLEFAEEELSGATLVELMTAINQGAPISRQSVHALAHRKGLTTRTWEEEMEAIEEEASMAILKPSDSADPEAEDDDDDQPGKKKAAPAGGKKKPTPAGSSK